MADYRAHVISAARTPTALTLKVHYRDGADALDIGDQDIVVNPPITLAAIKKAVDEAFDLLFSDMQATPQQLLGRVQSIFDARGG